MPKLSYPLKKYIKAVEYLVTLKGFREVRIFNKSGSAVHFDLFLGDEVIPHSMWQVHVGHKKSKIITSKEDYKKATVCLNCTMEELIQALNHK